MSKALKRITDQSIEAKGFVLYADDEWLEVQIDFKDGANSEGLYQLLSTRGIVEGVDDAKIVKLIEKFNGGEEVFQETIAVGRRPRPGRDGQLQFMIEMEPNKVEVTDVDGNIDFRDLNLIKEIFSGQPILKILPPDEGEDGVTVQGKNLAVPACKKAKYRLGKNVRLDEDSMTVFATADGHVEFVDPLISVQEEFVVHKTVDFTIGNLTFIGSLRFEGEIPPGYAMSAGKNIFVGGKVTGCNLKAKGNIDCPSGITGSVSTSIECDGSLTAKFINEANIICMGDATCFVEMVRSKVKVKGFLTVESGAIRGSEVYAFGGVKVKELGTPLGNPTFIGVGIDFMVDERIAKLQEAIVQLNDQKDKLKVAIEPFMKNKLLLVKAPEAKKSAVKTILNKIDAIDQKIKKVEQMVADQDAHRYDRTKQLDINGVIQDDVTIQIGNKKKKFDKAGKRNGFILYDKASFEIVFSRR
jgi:uncharacterized protein